MIKLLANFFFNVQDKYNTKTFNFFSLEAEIVCYKKMNIFSKNETKQKNYYIKLRKIFCLFQFVITSFWQQNHQQLKI